jgi:NADH-quinone oxidoreductase subunit F
VRTLKRFVVERVAPETYMPEVKPAAPDAPRVAVIGAGPSGLTAAHCLGALGLKVTLFEKESKPGGMLVGAIPEYRLPREILQQEIRALLNPNVELKRNQALGRDFTLDDLLVKQGFKAVYLATGSHQSRKLGVPGEDGTAGIIPGIKFLKAFNLHDEDLAKGRVGIVGGGNSAIDAARVALRQRGVTSVTVFYRRTRAEMPAYAEEIEAALEEGVLLKPLVAPVEVISQNGKLTGVKFIANTLGERDASGRRQPVPIPGSEHIVELDTVIAAISEQPEKDGLEGLELTRGGTVRANAESHLTSRPGVFAGGDVVSGPNTVIAAIAAGKDAAAMISAYLGGKLLKSFTKVKLPSVYIQPLQTPEDESEATARVKVPLLPAEKRRRSFAEVELCVSESDARCEARRCLRCDLDFTQPV